MNELMQGPDDVNNQQFEQFGPMRAQDQPCGVEHLLDPCPHTVHQENLQAIATAKYLRSVLVAWTAFCREQRKMFLVVAPPAFHTR